MTVEKAQLRNSDKIPKWFDSPSGTVFYLGDPGSESSGEEWKIQGDDVVFIRLPLPSIHTPSQGIFVQGKFKNKEFKDLSEDHPDAQWSGCQVFVRPPKL